MPEVLFKTLEKLESQTSTIRSYSDLHQLPKDTFERALLVLILLESGFDDLSPILGQRVYSLKIPDAEFFSIGKFGSAKLVQDALSLPVIAKNDNIGFWYNVLLQKALKQLELCELKETGKEAAKILVRHATPATSSLDGSIEDFGGGGDDEEEEEDEKSSRAASALTSEDESEQYEDELAMDEDDEGDKDYDEDEEPEVIAKPSTSAARTSRASGRNSASFSVEVESERRRERSRAASPHLKETKPDIAKPKPYDRPPPKSQTPSTARDSKPLVSLPVGKIAVPSAVLEAYQVTGFSRQVPSHIGEGNCGTISGNHLCVIPDLNEFKGPGHDFDLYTYEDNINRLHNRKTPFAPMNFFERKGANDWRYCGSYKWIENKVKETTWHEIQLMGDVERNSLYQILLARMNKKNDPYKFFKEWGFTKNILNRVQLDHEWKTNQNIVLRCCPFKYIGADLEALERWQEIKRKFPKALKKGKVRSKGSKTKKGGED